MFKFRVDRGVEREVGGQTVRFYMLPATALLQFRSFAPALAKAIATLFQSKDNDTGSSRKEAVDASGFRTTSFEAHAIDPDVLAARTKESSEAWVHIVQTITDKETLHAVIRLALQSMRDDFDSGDIQKTSTIEEIAGQLDLDVLVEMLQGTFAANRKLFDPFLEALPKNILQFGRGQQGDEGSDDPKQPQPDPENPGSTSSTTSTEA